MQHLAITEITACTNQLNDCWVFMNFKQTYVSQGALNTSDDAKYCFQYCLLLILQECRQVKYSNIRLDSKIRDFGFQTHIQIHRSQWAILMARQVRKLHCKSI